MKFTKMHGCGNDYVYVDCIAGNLTDKEQEDLSGVARRVSNRRTGVGADGLILIKSSARADFQMEMYNADGTIAEMCGNGIRCVGKYVYDYGLTDQTKITIDTRAGIKKLELNLKDGKVDTVRVDMGHPILTPSDIPVDYKGELNRLVDYTIQAGGILTQVTCISMGNPHAVLFLDDIVRADVKYLGSLLENHPIFPRRTNVEFVHVIDRSHLEMRVWERGTGETFACGTGSCASVVAAILHDFTDHAVTVSLLGGELLIEYEEETHTVYMTGPAVNIFDGITVES